MNYAAISTSPRRNMPFLTPAQQAQFKPSPSEEASRALWARIGARLPGASA